MMHEGHIYAVAFSPSGRTVMTVDNSATLRFWNITTGQQASQTNLGIPPESVINRAKITPDGNFAVVLHDGHTITTVRIR
jgi:WD40 repeat protein